MAPLKWKRRAPAARVIRMAPRTLTKRPWVRRSNLIVTRACDDSVNAMLVPRFPTRNLDGLSLRAVRLRPPAAGGGGAGPPASPAVVKSAGALVLEPAEEAATSV